MVKLKAFWLSDQEIQLSDYPFIGTRKKQYRCPALVDTQEDIMETTFLASFLGDQDYYTCGGTLIASQESSFTKFLFASFSLQVQYVLV